ncbi:MAG: lipid-A-disaccharide synthase [Prevotellaceae bacterium]|nr:lipid-A-disaccharide synthase [Prevotellaceae bacterium]
MNTIYIIAGEPSGDILASRLIRTLRERDAGLRFCGVGGETMAEQGFRSLFDIRDLSVMGFWEVLPKLPVILRRMRQVLAHIEQERPDVLVTVDSWGFVSTVLRRLKRRGASFPKVHYVAPQVWAWKKGRAKKAAQLLTHLMTLLPYEPPYFEKYGLPCTFVGHPVLENTAEAQLEATTAPDLCPVPAGARVLCILPGSRRNEIRKLAPVFIAVLEELQAAIPGLYVLLPSVAAMREEVAHAFAPVAVPHRVVVGQAARYAAFGAAEFAIAASGTVSLELAACGTPHIIAYKFNWLTNHLIARLATTRYANLINILADRQVIPEFVLHHCRADRIAPAALALMHDATRRAGQVEEAQRYLNRLKPPKQMPSAAAAETVCRVQGEWRRVKNEA